MIGNINPNPINTNGVITFNDTATTEIYTLSLHDALPIYVLILRCTSKCIKDAVIDSPERPQLPRANILMTRNAFLLCY